MAVCTVYTSTMDVVLGASVSGFSPQQGIHKGSLKMDVSSEQLECPGAMEDV